MKTSLLARLSFAALSLAALPLAAMYRKNTVQFVYSGFRAGQ